MNWYCRIRNTTVGPLDDDGIRQLIREGRLGRQDMVQNERTNGEWVPAFQMPLLAGLFPQKIDPAQQAENERLLRQAQEAQERQKMVTRLVVAAILLGLVLAVAGFVYYRTQTPYRIRGISSSSPIGTFERIDRYLTEDLQMDRTQITNCVGPRRTAPQVYTYFNPKAPRGANVTAGGTITLLVDDGRLNAIFAAFGSSGPRGGTFFNNSVCGIWAKQTWFLLDPTDPPAMYPPQAWPTNAWERGGLSDDIRKDGTIGLCEGPNFRGCWYEYEKYGLKTVILLETK